MITVPGFIPWLRYVVYSSSEGPECHLSHHHNCLQINGKNAFSYTMNMNIFIGNLNWSTTEDELHHLFYGYGTVDSVRIMTDRETGRSRGFAFVEMPDPTAAPGGDRGVERDGVGRTDADGQ